MSKIVLTPVTNGQNVSSINSNFTEIARQLNDLVLYRDNPASQANQVKQDVDFNGNNLLNVGLVDATDFTIGGASLDQGLVATVTAAAATAVAASVVSVNAAANATAITAGALQKTNNLSDLGSIATAKANLALDQVNNTSDANKPVSTATQTALNLKANIASPTFTGVPAAPTPATADNSTTIPTTAYVQLQFQNAQTPVFATSAVVRGAAGTSRGYYLYTGTTARWSIVESSTAESGSNVGSDLLIGRYNDAGSFLDIPLQISRATGNVTVLAGLTAQSQVIGNASTVGTQSIIGPVASFRGTQIYTGANLRWYTYADNTAEGGSNAGSDYTISRYNDAGTFIDSPVFISRATGAVRIKGNVAAVAAGYVGEILTSTNTGVGLSTSTNGNIVSMTLTAGVWDVSGVVHYIPAATTSFLRSQQGITTTSLTFAGLGSFTTNFVQATNSGNPDHCTPIVRVTVASNTTVYLVAQAVFTVSTMSSDGFIRATRVG